MAVVKSWYAVDTVLGLNFNLSYATTVNVASSVTSNSTTSDLAESMQVIAPDLLGTCRKGTDMSEWILLKASTTVIQYQLVSFDDGYNANPCTSGMGLSGAQLLALCQVQTYGGVAAASVDPGANPVFWGMIRGAGAQVFVSGSAGTGVAVNSGTSAGYISISTTGTAIKGVVLLVSGASGATECMIYYPRITALS